MELRLFSTLFFVFLAPPHCTSTGSYYMDDEKVLQEVRKEYQGYFEALGHDCDYGEFSRVVAPFWNDFFNYEKSHTDRHYDLVFNLKYSDIYVYFEDEIGEVDKTIYRYESPQDPQNPKIIPLYVNKVTQRQLEKSRCFTGGPMQCDEKKAKCVCMNNTEWLETQLMDETTGDEILNQDPTPGAGQACGVKLYKRCSRETYWVGTIFFDCVHNYFCHTFLNQCLPPIQPSS